MKKPLGWGRGIIVVLAFAFGVWWIWRSSQGAVKVKAVAVLSLVGGMVGIALGVGSAQMVAYLLHWPPLLSGWAILFAVSFSIAVGLFFGFYPALKAAKLEPMTALRYE